MRFFIMKNIFTSLLLVIFLSACMPKTQKFDEIEQPDSWQNQAIQNINLINDKTELKEWWLSFDDDSLNQLIDITLTDSPDRLIAAARIKEARGNRRSTRSFLFPQVNFSSSVRREAISETSIDNFYDARFDASYEVDVFGKNKKNVEAADAQIESLQASFDDVTITLIAEIMRSYIDYRAFQKQIQIAKKNLIVQEKTLTLIREQRKFGESPQLDVERAENIVNTTRASISEFKRFSANARLQLSVLSGRLPEQLTSLLKETKPVPKANEKLVLTEPAQVLIFRPDIRAAHANLVSNTKLTESTTAELFPTFTIGSFFGVAKNFFTNPTTLWNIIAGAAVSVLDFGRIEGRIDAAQAREVQAYQSYRKSILQAVTEVEVALSDLANIKQQLVSLQKAYENADEALHLSQILYREGEISFLNVLDSQRTVNESESAVITAEATQAESLVRLYKALGVY